MGMLTVILHHVYDYQVLKFSHDPQPLTIRPHTLTLDPKPLSQAIPDTGLRSALQNWLGPHHRQAASKGLGKSGLVLEESEDLML